MEFKPITINDKQMFNHYLAGRRRELITYNFSNFFLWRNWDPYGWAIVEDALCIKSDYIGLDTVIVPIAAEDGNVLRATEALIDWYRAEGREFIMSEVDDTMLTFFQQHWPGRFQAEEYPPGFNYVYHRDDLAYLRGKKYNSKRNHLHRFMKEYPEHQFLPLTANLVDGCREQLALWYSRQDTADPEIIHESQGVLDALEYMDKLDFTGAVLLLQGRVIAFTIGEPLNEDTIAIHIEKADTNILGAYQAINCFYARDYCDGYRYINRAEDMGNLGQRKAKLSYQPSHMVKKYYLRLAP